MCAGVNLADFDYSLPSELIAQAPLSERAAGRLLLADAAARRLVDRRVRELPELLRPGDLLVFNDTRVIKARLYARRPSGARVEVLLERLLSPTQARVQLKVSKKPKPGERLILDGALGLRVLGREGMFFVVESAEAVPLLELCERLGHVPLPPYVARDDTPDDEQRYQTVYARHPGSVAAPTAGLHFDEALLDALAERAIERAYITLHVGAGTFQPVREADPTRHRMHREWLEVNATAVAAIAAAKRRGGRVIAVGTTVVRALESAAGDGTLAPYQGDTELFIVPGFRFRVVEGLFTNFHLPRSTLLMLVSAFAGREFVLGAYAHAVAQRYRFFSYGDAMLLWPPE